MGNEVSFNSHKIGYDLYSDSVSAVSFWMDKANTLAEKRAFADNILQAQADATKQFPLISGFHYTDVEVTKHTLTVHITIVDSKGQSKLLTPRYTFPAVNLPELIAKDESFADALAFMVLLQGIVPLSMMTCGPNRTLLTQYANSSVMNLFPAMSDSDASIFVKNATIRMFESQLTGEQFLQKVIAFFAWNDRMSVTRLLAKHPLTAVHEATVNPGYVMDAPVEYTYEGHPTADFASLKDLRSLVSFSWGKESLLSAQIVERLCPSVCYGIVKHDYADETAEGFKAYQGDYDAFRKGTRYEDANFLVAGNGYLTLIYNLVPSLPGVSHAMHHMYGMCHLLNAWEQADAIFLGDELERNFRNPIYRATGADSDIPAPAGVLGYNQIKQALDTAKVEGWGEPAHHTEDIYSANGEVIFEQVGYDFGFDFHQSEHMHRMLNGVLRSFHPTKLIGSPVYNYSEIAIQFLLSSIDKQAFSYQASCWYASEALEAGGSKWCNSCEKCHRLAWVMKALDIDHEAFGLKYVSPFTYLKPEEITGNKVFAITADPHSQGYAYSTCDAAVKFMLLRTVCEDQLSKGYTVLPKELNFSAREWVLDIQKNLLLTPHHESNVVELGVDQHELVDPHLAKFNELVHKYLAKWWEQL